MDLLSPRGLLLGAALASAWIVISASCTTILGIDTDYKDNPCVGSDAGAEMQTCGRGACFTLAKICDNGLPVSCAGLETAAKSDEMCDGVDNDCNGAIDEGCPCEEGATQPCFTGSVATRSIGLCHDGEQQCIAGQWGDCKASVVPIAERCGNGRDDDCNGKIDDGCPCTVGQKQTCYAFAESTLGTGGPCKQGTQTCQADGSWGDCVDQVPPTLETCNGIDDDCDGEIDDHITCACHVNTDCPSGLCKNGVCAPLPSCTDQTKNGSETDVDCGGPTCPVCDDYKTCILGSDCKSGVCNGSFCVAATCADQTKNGTETDVDCGGPTCQKCDPYKACNNGSDCKSGICNTGTQTCSPASCSDGLKNGTETDVDCGGPGCPSCPDASHCVLPTDCDSDVCEGNLCVAPTCLDGIHNGTETDTDCGGASCAHCADGKACTGHGDCTSGVCKTLVCQPATCTDQAKNGTETDTDCGGPGCPPCAIGKACSGPGDCATGMCNGVCSPKPNGQPCASGGDCTSSFCVDGVCCDSACLGTCRACAAGKKGSGQDGTCGNVAAASDPDNECATDPQSSCGRTGLCDGAGACQIYPNVAVCQPAACATGTTLNLPHTCDGGGQCSDNGAKDCTPFACNGGACKASCTYDVDCAPSAYCLGAGCVQKKPVASACGAGNECSSGYCVDSVCCNAACDSTCQACNLSGHVGSCTSTPAGQQDLGTCGGNNVCNGSGACLIGGGTPCTQGSQCASGFCVDGYCCNNACSGVCQACNVPGQAGTCAAVPAFQQDSPGCVGQSACDGAGACLLGNGAACTFATQCASGLCVDGVCCANACSGTCQACNVPGSLGICTFTAALQPDLGTCGGSSVCNGAGLCLAGQGVSCAQNGDCAGGICVDGVCCQSACTGNCQTCNLAGSVGTCVNTPAFQQDPGSCGGNSVCNGSGACLLNDGIGCTQHSQCASGFCVDGYCCNSACSGVCQACNVAGSVGTCAAVPAMAADPPACVGASVCNGAASCLLGGGVACTQNNQCVTGFCVDGVCCDSACTGACRACSTAKKGGGADGACGPVLAGSDPDKDCTPYMCSVAACLNKCAADTDCATGNYCLLTACVTKKTAGASCGAANECQSGHCVDGVCCNSACGGTCQACNLAGSAGTCTSTPQGLTDSPGCTAPNACNGAGACLLDLGVACAQNSQCASGYCVDGYCCNTACTATCQACNVTGSVGTCTNTQAFQQDPPSCVGSNVCNGSGSCLGSGGVACSQNSQCASGYCVDGVCCTSACSGVCQSCNVAGSVGSCVSTPAFQQDSPSCLGSSVCTGTGSCLLGNGIACALGNQCASGNCVDGVCCNTACTGTCQSCSVAGSVGSCVSTPSGQQDSPACVGNGVCNGTGTCLLSQGSACSQNSQCLTGKCVEGVCCNASCSGGCQSCTAALTGGSADGTCAPILADTDPKLACGAYTCSGAGACFNVCSKDADCAAGNYCSSGACTTKKAIGLACGAGHECQSGNCVDGVCCNSGCSATCQSCSVAGSIGTCVSTPAFQPDAPGCTGTSVCNGSGSCLAGNGVACSIGAQCASGHCVDGVCCGSACNGTCQSCNVAGSVGTCASTPALQPDAPGCTGTSVCNGAGSCLAGHGVACTQASQCASGYCVDGVCCSAACSGTCQSCNAAGSVGTCVSTPSGQQDAPGCVGNNACNGAGSCLANLGTACAQDSQCLSGRCVEGVCCNSACSGGCQSCTAALTGGSSDGTCAPILADTDPRAACGAYTCNGSGACFSACTKDADCAAGKYCNGVGACVTKKAAGQACGAGNECATGNCTDGVCCSSTSCGGCASCATGGNGTCTPFPADTDPKASCGLFMCDGAGACLTTCSGDADCHAGNYCASGACTAKKAAGAACAAANQCSSGNCVDGVCCSSASCGGCSTCAVSGNGTCTPFPVDTDPKASCGLFMCDGAGACLSTCSGDADCHAGNYCASGACTAKMAAGAACTAANQCSSDNCVDGVCCSAASCGGCSTCAVSGNGTCTPFPADTDPKATCGLFMCDGAGACLTTCSGDADCHAGNYCASGACTAKKAPGAACAAANQCSSGNCVDGVCCSAASCGGCSTCAVSGNGTCTPFPADTDPKASCGLFMCDGAGACLSTCSGDADCHAGNYCASGACTAKKAPGAACAAANQCSTGNCVDGVCCSSASCGGCSTCAVSGNGTCTPFPADTDPKASCGLFMCDGAGACLTTCSGDADCHPGNYCASGACTAKKAPGAACAAANQCSTGNCVDGVCCSSASCGGCSTCAVSGNGTCTPFPADTDPKASCGLYTCDGAGACLSTCSGDADCHAGNYCASGACTAKKAAGAACAAANQCSSGNCVDGVCCSSASCGGCSTCAVSGNGTCTPFPVDTDPKASCGLFMCDGAGACLTTCSGDADCHAGNYCASGACTAKKAAGQVCGAGNECATGNCVDGVCCSAASCGGCSTCAVSGNGTCTPFAADTDPKATCGLYTCDGAGACLSTCSVDADCHAGNYCASGACTAKKAAGAACAAANQCSSGNCVDGVCCSAASCGGCSTCAVSGNGTCTPFPVDTDPKATCGLYTCDGAGACLSTCSVDADCHAGNYCASGACTAKMALAQVCGAGNECSSGNCVDGVCCSSASCGTCASCAVAGSEGACADLAVGDTDDTCAGPGMACDGAGLCLAESGELCGGDAECLSNLCDTGACAACTAATACPIGKACNEASGFCE